ncbi:MAG: transposase [Actinomycetota bacterium]|nr:transposase [Actinomycetota bacterium]
MAGLASRSPLKRFVKLARTIPRYRAAILAAVRFGLSNARLELASRDSTARCA